VAFVGAEKFSKIYITLPESDGWMGGWVDEWMGGWMNEWVDGWMDEWMDG